MNRRGPGKGRELEPPLSRVSWLVVRSISTAYPQDRFSGCVSVHMGLLRTRSQARKTRHKPRFTERSVHVAVRSRWRTTFDSLDPSNMISTTSGDTTMGDDEKRSGTDRRAAKERRSGTDTRSEEEKRLVGERRSQNDRRSDQDRRAERGDKSKD